VSNEVVPASNVEVNHQVIATQSKSTVPICAHIKDDGIRCGTPAVSGRHFCYYHCRAHHPGARIATRRYRAPIPESVASLQIALAHTLQALVTGDISPKQANSMMYGINLGTNLLRLSKPMSEAEKQQVVTEIPEAMQEVLVEPEAQPDIQPRNTTPHTPKYSTRPAELTEGEIEILRSKILTKEEFQKCKDDYETFQGTDDPRYLDAVNRICDHQESLSRLRNTNMR
jgi:hypothetical protein